MAEDTEGEDDVALLNNDDGDDRLISAGDRRPRVDAVFVVTFDVKYGNTIEFQMPEEERMPLTGVEYKAIPSGSHHIHEDFVYFRHENRYGLACIARKELQRSSYDGASITILDHTQRGLCIKSVGILTRSIRHIQSYLQFLQTEAQAYLTQTSVNYDRLKELLNNRNQLYAVPIPIYDDLFNAFIDHFGPSIFPLSRLVLLDKRILLYSNSPIGTLCNAVYFAHMLNQLLKALFFITILDLSILNSERSYIACTTERIFKEKHQLYDAFIDCDKHIHIHTDDPTLQSIVRITRHDRNRLKKTMTLNSFINMGNRISQVMDRVSQSTTNQQLNKDDFQSLDLHQRYDRLFLSEYIRLHNIPNVTISTPNTKLFPLLPCCPCPNGN